MLNLRFTATALVLALAAGGIPGAASAQSAKANRHHVVAAPAPPPIPDRGYESGTVWRVSKVETKPGMFDDYIKYLSGSWRAIQEAGEKTGDVVSYKVLVVDSPRDHEPNVVLMVEYRDMAVFDRSLKDTDAQTAAIFGSVAKAQASAVDRETLRSGRGQVLLRELKFTN
jgi:hypothetical protein